MSPNPAPTPPLSGNAPPVGFFSRTENKIFGGQLTAQIFRPVAGRLYLEGGAAGGYGFNQITTESDTAGDDNDTRTRRNAGTGFISFNGGFNFQPTNGVTLRAGYEGLFLGNVGLAPDQSAGIVTNGAEATISTGGLYFGGVYVGAVFAF